MKDKEEQVKAPPSSSSSSLCFSFQSLVRTKATYQEIARDFHRYHRHDVNVALHWLTTTLGVWGAVQLILLLLQNGGVGLVLVMVYAVWILLTVPLFPTAILHTVVLSVLCLVTPPPLHIQGQELALYWTCLAAIVAGYGLQDLAHYICQEPTYMDSYIATQPWMLVAHSVYLLPLVLEAVNLRYWFVPSLVVPRNRNIATTTVASRHAVNQIRNWIAQNIPSVPETTHVWPHQQDDVTDKATLALEQDAAILQAFRTVFATHHYDIRPVQDMNEIYVTAVGSKKDINSDAVFYTPHTDGPYWFLPGASLYRVLVGLTPNQMVRTRFNLQHDNDDDDDNHNNNKNNGNSHRSQSQSKVVDLYGVLGFDYNRELHWIDHVPNVQQNTERRSLMKLHYIVYPKGWHRYGQFCANLNTNYNTWARGNFLQTLRPSSVYDHVLAWWIWWTTWFNAIWVEYVGWNNLVYIAAAYLLSPSSLLFEIVTSFRHYVLYMATFQFRQPMVAHGVLIRDARLYKTIAMMHLGRRVLPWVSLPHDLPGVLLAALGFAVTLAATARLGMVRTYFGAELGFCNPKWIDGFPYGTIIPHPMIVGQLFAFAAILVWFGNRLSTETIVIIGAHMLCYTIHMIQEMLSSSY